MSAIKMTVDMILIAGNSSQPHNSIGNWAIKVVVGIAVGRLLYMSQQAQSFLDWTFKVKIRPVFVCAPYGSTVFPRA